MPSQPSLQASRNMIAPSSSKWSLMARLGGARLLYVGIVDSLSSQVNDFGWLGVEESDMKYLALASLCTALASLAVFLLVTALTDANAVCARGVYRAGCAGPHGAAVVHRRSPLDVVT